MTQEATQLRTDPPYPGLAMVQDINKLAQTLGTDFAGATDPGALAWAYTVWADTGTNTVKRRNAANSAWVIEGRLLRAHLPMYAQVDVPALDIGPIYIIGKGPAEWVGAAYKPLTSGIPGATFAELNSAEADQGPVFCIDMAGLLWTWQSSAYFEGYRSARCGLIYGGAWADPDPWDELLTGGVWSESDPKQARLIAKFREKGRTVPVGDWLEGWGYISDLGAGDWKAPDYQNVFLRMAGTDVDTANARLVGEYQKSRANAFARVVTQSLTTSVQYGSADIPEDGSYSDPVRAASGGTTNAEMMFRRSAGETRGESAAVLPVILI